MLGRALLTLDSLGLLFGAWVADMNHTHQRNPRWPPHAKFHNAQTIGLSTVLGLATLYLTWRPLLLGPSPATDRFSLRLAAFTGSAYWLTGLTAIYFPGADGLDPEFGGPGFPQRPVFLAFMIAGLAGSYLELR
ncbi:hypothetical protein UCDDA912_g09047 [Diaporthe ampelina]|uniref:Integral membrane protein n=1 Tax=Diaporthe ampelina TaxID=1214573 RepID=A0A0G2F9Y4_9PEZI|nr:hypothetical protein UCDDA912_g09047 [Diaporthe ampelina]